MARKPAQNDDAPEAAPEKDGESKAEGRRGKRLMTGAAIGIGSAALVAALLYANRARKSDKS
jgi:hypothetical protein